MDRVAPPAFVIGVDVGTSGCRAVALDRDGRVVAQAKRSFPKLESRADESEQDPQLWWEGTLAVVTELTVALPNQSCRALCIAGTSGTALLCDAAGTPLGPALLYNDGRAQSEAQDITHFAPAATAAHGVGSSLAKALWLLRRESRPVKWVAHQADWIAGHFTGQYGFSDSNSALKTGFDPITGTWPAWLAQLGIPLEVLPSVYTPGTKLGPVTLTMSTLTGLAPDCRIIAGTTDSTAAVIASGATNIGDAVTSLGSTLVTKVISAQPFFAPEHGVYSQPFGAHWLVGGGSNSGGAVLRAFFTDEQMIQLEKSINSTHPTGLDYYPLLRPGERFPLNDPHLAPRLTPRPSDDAVFFQGLLEGLANIELAAYRRLEMLGSPYPNKVLTVGGGCRNQAWRHLREQRLGVPVLIAEHQDACYGAAQLALSALF